ncbi:hypothetical protein MIR68_012466 [Amoeboaphelidium protococcarum]|nr:hypothetical protein MIR68_012466 [Amoeboaphelidium protococcarum]
MTIKKVAVVGAGLMGSGIAHVVAQSGLKVSLIDASEKALSKGVTSIEKNLAKMAAKKYKDSGDEAKQWTSQVMANISTSTSLESSGAIAKDCDLVIEAIVENLDAKISLFKKVNAIAPQHTILASNTSSIPITQIMSGVHGKDGGSQKRSGLWAGLHFFNPVPLMKLVEVVNLSPLANGSVGGTSDQTFKSLVEFSKTLGKSPVKCKDTPGFIVNRLLVPYMIEAISLYERGDASVEDIDTAMKLGAGYPMGPFTLADMVGLDTLKFIVDGWEDKGVFPKDFKKSQLLVKMVNEGKLGRKSGRGFYDYTQQSGANSKL